MQKVIVSHIGGKFGGAFELLYGEPGMGVDALPPLVLVDMRGAQMNDRQKAHLLSLVPTRLGTGFETAFDGPDGVNPLRFVYEGAEVTFDLFWDEYRHKENRKRCETIWNRLSKADRALAVKCIASYLRYLDSHKWRNKAGADTYLNEKYWQTNWDNLE